MSATMTIPATLNSKSMCRRADVTYRQLTCWVRRGVFGEERRLAAEGRGPGDPGRGQRLAFTGLDIVVARACGRVALALEGRACTDLLSEVADQVRAGATVVRVRLGDHVELTVDVSDLREGE